MPPSTHGPWASLSSYAYSPSRFATDPDSVVVVLDSLLLLTDAERQRLAVAPSAMAAVGVKTPEAARAKHLSSRIQRAMLAIAARRAGERLAVPEFADRRASLLATVFAGESAQARRKSVHAVIHGPDIDE